MRGDGQLAHDAGNAMAAPVLAVVNVFKSFGDRVAVAGVSFDLEAGTFVAVLGPSGVGKSTLFRCIAGLETPDDGRIRFEDRNLADLPQAERRRIAIIFQQFNLIRRMTALDNVLAGRLGYAPWWRGVLRRFERADTLKALQCLDRVGMLDYARQRADTLSGGQQQRVAVARALAQDARLIVADEPVASLDPASATGVLQLLRDIVRDDGVSVICSLHQVGYARGYADRIIGMSSGQITVDARTSDLDEDDIARLYTATADAAESAAPSDFETGNAPAKPPGADHAADRFTHFEA